MTGRLLSLIAIPLSLLGHLLFWTGSSGLLRATQLLGAVDPVSVILTAAGILCIAAAIATVAIGSLGAIIIGALHLAFSLLLFVFPFSPASGITPAWDVMNALRSLSQETSDGMYFYVPTGFAFLTGAIFLAAGLAASARRTVTPTSRARVLSGLAGVLGIVGIVLALAGGGRLYISVLVTLSGIEPFGLFLLAAGSVLVALAVSAARWSSAGALVAGGVATVAGLVALAAPGQVSRAIFAWPELRRALEIAGPSGTLLLIGVLLVIAGLAVRVRARRAV